MAGRDASRKVLNALAQSIPWLLGGSADLGPSNKTTLTYEGAGSFQAASPGGKNLHFGVREHAMAAIVNGLSLSKLRAFGATFFIFSDYARPAIRLSFARTPSAAQVVDFRRCSIVVSFDQKYPLASFG